MTPLIYAVFIREVSKTGNDSIYTNGRNTIHLGYRYTLAERRSRPFRHGKQHCKINSLRDQKAVYQGGRQTSRPR